MTALQSVTANLRWSADAKEVALREEFEELWAAQDENLHQLSASIAGMVAAVDEFTANMAQRFNKFDGEL